jgi:hypothetical protein
VLGVGACHSFRTERLDASCGLTIIATILCLHTGLAWLFLIVVGLGVA